MPCPDASVPWAAHLLSVFMAHKRKDTFVKVREWWKHLRPFNKRMQAKAERRAIKRMISDLIFDR
jgi:hypothetical protein